MPVRGGSHATDTTSHFFDKLRIWRTRVRVRVWVCVWGAGEGVGKVL